MVFPKPFQLVLHPCIKDTVDYLSKTVQQRDSCNVGGFRLDVEMGVACAAPKCHLHQSTKTNPYQSGHNNTEMLNFSLGEREYSFPSEFIFKFS